MTSIKILEQDEIVGARSIGLTLPLVWASIPFTRRCGPGEISPN